MSVFENFTKKVSDTAKAAAKKSGDIVEITKLNMNVGSEEDKIEKKYSEIGKLLYESYVSGKTVGEEFKPHCEEIEKYFENVSAMKQKIQELKKIKNCPVCGAELEADVLFCPKCGTKQEIPESKEEPEKDEKEPDELKCPSCGAEYESETAFCPKCGTKLTE
jgi:predicted RNA-binding Zn-ribbon protein involved in translation (DUF1610 family)